MKDTDWKKKCQELENEKEERRKAIDTKRMEKKRAHAEKD